MSVASFTSKISKFDVFLCVVPRPASVSHHDCKKDSGNKGTCKKPAKRKNKVLIIDASSLFRKGRAQNFLDPEHGDQIVTWFRAFKDVEDRAKVVTLDEIKEEDWTLNISRYVLPPIGEDIPPLPDAVAAFKDALNEARKAEDHLRTVLTKGGWLK